MKILLIILGIIALIIIALLLFPVRVSLRIKLTKDSKAQTQIALFGKKLPSKGTLQKIIKHLGFKGTVDFLFSPEIGFWRRIGYILKKLVIKKFRLNVTVASDDAAQTALLYGGVCAVLYPVVGFLETVMDFREDNMKIICDYEASSPDLDFFAEIKIRVFHLLTAVFKIIPDITKILKEVKKNEQ